MAMSARAGPRRHGCVPWRGRGHGLPVVSAAHHVPDVAYVVACMQAGVRVRAPWLAKLQDALCCMHADSGRGLQKMKCLPPRARAAVHPLWTLVWVTGPEACLSCL